MCCGSLGNPLLHDAFSFFTAGGPKNVTMNVVPPHSRSFFYRCEDEVFQTFFLESLEVGYHKSIAHKVRSAICLIGVCLPLDFFNGLADFPTNITNFCVQLRDRNVDHNPNDGVKLSNNIFQMLCK